MSARTTILTALAALAVGTVATVAMPATAQAKDRIVQCMDGTVFNFGPDDAISNEVACAGHGGVKPASPFKAQKIKSNGSSSVPKKPMRVTGGNTAGAAVPDGSFGGKNKAVAWTAGCYAEFGPNATHPDAAMLEKCLGN